MGPFGPPQIQWAPVRTTVIGICGGSGSGKSTLARRLERSLGIANVAMIEFDSYYHDLSHLDPAERAMVNFDHPNALDVDQFCADIATLARGAPVDVPVYDFATHTRSNRSIPIEPRPVIVADGILLLAFIQLVDLIDHAVFLDVPEDVRFARRLARDVRERGREPSAVKRQFEQSVRPMHDLYVQPSAARADQIIVDGPDPGTAAALVTRALGPVAGALA